jgi:hypothetical protein
MKSTKELEEAWKAFQEAVVPALKAYQEATTPERERMKTEVVFICKECTPPCRLSLDESKEKKPFSMPSLCPFDILNTPRWAVEKGAPKEKRL